MGGVENAGTEPVLIEAASQDDRYKDAAEQFGSALERLARAWEIDPEKRRDLIQDIHFQL